MLKKFLLVSLLASSSLATARPLQMKHFPWVLDDVAEMGLSKEELFQSMPRKMLSSSSAICSNKALMWLYDFKSTFNVDGSKVFLFFTQQSKTKGWWYHVAPIINEGGTEWVMDAGGLNNIKGPLLVQDWLRSFSKSPNCYEIKPHDRDLLQLMHEGYHFPAQTYRGNYNCYYIKAPAGNWFPSSVAQDLLGTDAQGNPVNVYRREIDREEVFKACKEAVTGPIRALLGMGDKKCENFVNRY